MGKAEERLVLKQENLFYAEILYSMKRAESIVWVCYIEYKCIVSDALCMRVCLPKSSDYVAGGTVFT